MPKIRKFWTPEKDALLGTDSDCAIAKRLGVTHAAVWQRRQKLGIPACHLSKTKWGECEIALFRSYCDKEIQRMTGRTLAEVVAKRRSL
jgi:hypothetical protein